METVISHSNLSCRARYDYHTTLAIKTQADRVTGSEELPSLSLGSIGSITCEIITIDVRAI